MVTRTSPIHVPVVGRGIVRALQLGVEGATRMNVCRFQIERKNAQGRQLPPVPVEMRSVSFTGQLSNGDWVDVKQSWTVGELLRPKEVMNLTTMVPFRSTMGVANAFRAYPTAVKLSMVGSLLVFLIIFAIFGVLLFSHGMFPIFGSAPELGAPTAVGRPPAQNAAFIISSDSAPAGATLRASGTGWEPSEAVVFRYGPEVMGQTSADRNGSFANAPITVPSDANGFFKTVDATGQSSLKTVSETFSVVVTVSPSAPSKSSTPSTNVSPSPLACPALPGAVKTGAYPGGPVELQPGPNVPAIVIATEVASVGQLVSVAGSGFQPNDAFALYISSGDPQKVYGPIVIPVASGTTDASGHFSLQMVIPSGSPTGCAALQARDSLYVAFAPLTIQPS